MSENTSNGPHREDFTEQLAAYQKIWMETFGRMMQNAFTSPPDAAPPEVLRQMRSGILQALAQSWDEYLRSPQFAEGMKQWMDSAIHYRQMTNELLTRVRHETQDVARQDIDSVLLAIQHLEKRLLDRIEELSGRIDQVSGSKPNKSSSKIAPKPATPPKRDSQRRLGKKSKPLRSRGAAVKSSP